MITFEAQIRKVETMVDGGNKVVLFTQELSAETMADIFLLKGQSGKFLFKPDDEKIEEEKPIDKAIDEVSDTLDLWKEFNNHRIAYCSKFNLTKDEYNKRYLEGKSSKILTEEELKKQIANMKTSLRTGIE